LVGERMRPFYLEAVRVQSDRLRVIVNGIDVAPRVSVEERLRRRAELGLPSDAVLVGAAGRLAPEKNLGFLLRATAAVRARGVPLQLVLIGEGDSRSELERLAEELGIRRFVTFLGWRTDVPRILSALDVYALTSLSEGLPLALLEGMAASLPVISTAVGDVPVLVQDGFSGFLIEQGDVAMLADRLERLACAPQLREAMGSAAHDVVQQGYNKAAMVDRYLEAYQL
jgi:glycosyltransferase involved in cell wall biosynthesis